jgi:predicted transglutaminase-like cysteine proteinase
MIRILMFALLIATLPITSAHSRPQHDYRWPERHLHVPTIESRLSAWEKRMQEHHAILMNSFHPKILRWREQLRELKTTGPLQFDHLVTVNELVNADITYVDDYSHYRKNDYWAELDLALMEGGDCEDIALAKAVMLLALGLAPDHKHLLIGYLIEDGRNDAHAVLVVDVDPHPDKQEHYVMRSITNDVLLLADYEFKPVYAVDSEGVLVFKQAN